MRNKDRNQYLRLFFLNVLLFGVITFETYGHNMANNKEREGDLNAVELQEEEEIDNKERDKEPIKAKESFYGSARFDVAKNIRLSHPASTDFYPTLIIMRKKQMSDDLAFFANLKLGFEKIFIVAEKPAKIDVAISATVDKAKLSTLYFERGIFEESAFSLGLKKNNFCRIAAYSGPANVLQIGCLIPFKPIEMGFAIEQAKDLVLYPKAVEEKDRHLKPSKEVPAASIRFNYTLPNALGEIELSGLFRLLEWYSSLNNKFNYDAGYGINLGSKLKLNKEVLILTVNTLYGSAIGNYLEDMAELEQEENSVYVRKVDKKIEVKSIDIWAAYANLQYQWTPLISSNLMGGATIPVNQVVKDRPHAYGMGYHVKFNTIYSITDKVDVGAEYAWGGRRNLDPKTSWYAGSHIKLFGSFSFRVETDKKELKI